MRRLMLAAVLMLTQFQVGAGYIYANSTALIVEQHANGLVVVSFYGTYTRSTPPACATETNRMTLQLGDMPHTATLLNTIVQAKVNNRGLTLVGTGQCSQRANMESIDFLVLE